MAGRLVLKSPVVTVETMRHFQGNICWTEHNKQRKVKKEWQKIRFMDTVKVVRWRQIIDCWRPLKETVKRKVRGSCIVYIMSYMMLSRCLINFYDKLIVSLFFHHFQFDQHVSEVRLCLHYERVRGVIQFFKQRASKCRHMC